jgi:NAD(P)-dependent dehydrogenase (short-subunit alcohol dehydrogenase family)
LEIALPDRHVCLLIDDGSPIAPNLAKLLKEKGWNVVTLSFPQSLVAKQYPLPEGVDRLVLENMSEEHLQQQLAKIAEIYGSIAALIHIHPQFSGNRSNDLCFSEEDRAIVKHLFFVAKHLKQSLNRSATKGFSCFLTVAHLDGEFGLGGTTNYSPIGAGLFGLTKTLNQEWKKVFCRAIDLNPELNIENAVRSIFAELHDPNRLLCEIGYSLNGRKTLIV